MQVLVLFLVLSPAFAQNRSRRPPTYYKKSPGLILPDNATSIRENIVDTFSCENRIYGYYADMDNECQIFHVCLPQARHIALFVCMRNESSIPCEESEKFYNLNEIFGEVEEPEITEIPGNELDPTTRPPYKPPRPPSTEIFPQQPLTDRPTFEPEARPPSLTPLDYPTQRPTRPSLLNYPTTPQRPNQPTSIIPKYPTSPQRPTQPNTIALDNSILQQFPPRRTARPPAFAPQFFTPDYPSTFYYSQRPGLGSRPWQ